MVCENLHILNDQHRRQPKGGERPGASEPATMLRPKYQHDHPQRGERGGSISSRDTGDTVSSSVCYDAMSSFNVTVSLQPKSPARPASSQNAGAERSGAPLSLGSASIGSQSFGSISTTVSQPQSLTESIGSFDAEKVQIEAQKALVRPTHYCCM